MNRRDFDRLIAANDFREMFISYLGWSRPTDSGRLMPIILDDVEYRFRAVAQRSGLHVLMAEVDELPRSALARRIDNQLRRQAQDYIAIYVRRNEPNHHQWIVPLKNVDKRDLVSLEYISTQQAEFLHSKLDAITFSPGDVTTIVDVKEAVHRAFFVNSEKITKDFYQGFKKQHTAFAKFISGIDDEIPDKDNRNKQWYASVMLNRLMFCYFIQKKGFLDGNVNYLRDKLDACIRQRGENQFFTTFYLRFLRRLFADGLNSPRHGNDFQKEFGRIPYLNGGMFDNHQLERDYEGIDIADEAFVSLFDFFDRWQWHLDTRVTASGRDINPDVLGYIFEQYINDRAEMGAYYTKEDITEYIGRNTILPFVFDKVKGSSDAMAKQFAPDGFVWQTLRRRPERYLFDAVKRGYTPDWRTRIPANIAQGLDTSKPQLLERRADWNSKTSEPFALPTEIWRETVERLQRVDDILGKIRDGEVTSVNDLITYNLDIRQLAADLVAEGDTAFVYNFYDALRSVTILDPTCGSGAFLFAAMNILEPLYYDCITRMQGFPNPSPRVKAALDEITAKYRSNIHYFIYKSIILRNLYGVDIMAEATEIAKLRLFLKMVAVVDVDYSDPQLGLDPLPDIDFNIRCGNTLVGYANAAEIDHDLNTAATIDELLANDDFKARIEQEMRTVAATYREFKRLQLVQEEHFAEFKEAKNALRERLSTLNDTLSRRLFMATKGQDPTPPMGQALYQDWLASHKPFHWLAEFYSIVHDNGGFDVIIGNPPYVEYNKKSAKTGKSVSEIYTLNGYRTIECGNLYAYVIERSKRFSKSSTRVGYIVPSASIGTPRMELLFRELQKGALWTSIWDERPSKLFDGVDTQICIHLYTLQENCPAFITRMIHWHTEMRPFIFKSLSFYGYNKRLRCALVVPKVQNETENQILNKIHLNSCSITFYSKPSYNTKKIYYKNAGGRYWRLVKSFPTFYQSEKGKENTSTEKIAYIDSQLLATTVCSLSSSIFYWYWRVVSNCRHLTNRELESFRIPQNLPQNLFDDLFCHYEADLRKNKSRSTTNNKNSGEIQQDFYYVKQSKVIIDEIDKVLAKHYGFTEEELDFIINYDIKYRMGDELNSNDNE
ncbi:MAG: Eco57I restriction-modification methylase domain-containing protein [Bacteroidales bacterium]|nr:Eco57I restriction-modification methylase domain-containing protein [Bacteroidales bacterium]